MVPTESKKYFLYLFVIPNTCTGGHEQHSHSFSWPVSLPVGTAIFFRSHSATQWQAGYTEAAHLGPLGPTSCWWGQFTTGVEGDQRFTILSETFCTPHLRLKWGGTAEKHAQCLWDPWAQSLSSMLLYLPEGHVVLLTVLLTFLPSQSVKIFKIQLRYYFFPSPLLHVHPQISSWHSLDSQSNFTHYVVWD